jgi:hypothetical protein
MKIKIEFFSFKFGLLADFSLFRWTKEANRKK